jgi:hypothetical protein
VGARVPLGSKGAIGEIDERTTSAGPGQERFAAGGAATSKPVAVRSKATPASRSKATPAARPKPVAKAAKPKKKASR